MRLDCRLIGALIAASLFGLLSSISGLAAHSEETATGGGQVKVVELTTDRRNSKGKLDSCEIVYTVAFEDNIYRGGGVSFLRGSVTLMGVTGDKTKAPGIMLKATAFDVVNGKPVFAPLSLAYISAKGKSYAGQQITTFTCDDGGQCVAYNMMEHPDLGIDLGEGFEVNFTRANGNSDVRVPVKIFPDHLDVFQGYNACVSDLLVEIEKKMQ